MSDFSAKSPLWKDPLVQGTLMQMTTPHAWQDHLATLSILEKTGAMDAETLTASLLAVEEDEDFMCLCAGLYPEKAAGMIETWKGFWDTQDTAALFLKDSDGPLKVTMATLIDEVINNPGIADIADSVGKMMLDLGLQAKTDGYARKLPPKLVEAYAMGMDALAPLVTNPNIEKNLQDVGQLLISDVKKYLFPVITAPGNTPLPSINLN